MRTCVALPGEPLPDAYFDVRYSVLREPLGAPRGSEHIAGDDMAVHVWIENEGRIVSVGRALLIPDNEDGSAHDTAANSPCPPFRPLGHDYRPLQDDNGNPVPHDPRPAIQIRQMGTLQNYRRTGLAEKVLNALERTAIEVWDMRSGWLQARIEALSFYRANGWACFGEEYEVPNVGSHRSMWKEFKTLTP